MNKKGFTLVELLAVIVIIGILIVLTVPNLLTRLSESKEESLDQIKNIIISAARNYAIDYKIQYPLSISIDELCEDEYLDCPIVSPVDNSNVNGYVIANNAKNYIYSETNLHLYEITNIVQNSDFENGTDGWTLNGTVTISNGIAAIVATRQYGGIFQTYSNGTLLRGHKIYSTAFLKSDYGSLYWIGINDGTAELALRVTTTNTWQKLSGIFNFSINSSNSYFKTEDPRTTGWTTYYLKEPMVIDLTDTFGAGNEPSKEWCDENINYFDGTSTIYK